MSVPARRVAILGARGIPARYGGFETFAEEIAVRLVASGVEVTVFCEKGPDPGPAEYRGVKLAYVPATACGPFTTILFDLRSLWRARRSFDVVYMLGYGAAFACFLPRLWGTRVWLNVDGIEWARAKWGAAARAYFRVMEALSLCTPTRVIADAAAIRDHLLGRHATSTPIEVIPYGARIQGDDPGSAALERWHLVPGGYYLAVCRLEPENHVLEMIEGFRRCGSCRQLVVVGDHRRRDSYVAALTACQDQRVCFIGTVFDQEALRCLRYHAFAYCHGHSVGGTNPSLLEALGCGNAVIAHDNPFNREVARAAAVYFRSSDEFTARLDELEGTGSKRSEMCAQARPIVQSDYTWEVVTRQYLDLLRREVGA